MASWNEVTKKRKYVKKRNYVKKTYIVNNFLTVRAGCEFKIRLIGIPIKIFRLYIDGNKQLLVKEKVYKELINKYPELIKRKLYRYFSICIDRDNGKLRILDMPDSVAKKFGSRTQNIKKEISGIKEGCDWLIKTNGKTGINVRYEVVYLKETPLTEEENKMVQEKLSWPEFNLNRFGNTSLKTAIEKIGIIK